MEEKAGKTDGLPPKDREARQHENSIDAANRREIKPVEQIDLSHVLQERLNELDCLYSIASIIETPGISLEGILDEVVKVLPLAWQYPEVACARIFLEGREYCSYDFEPSPWFLRSDIMVTGNKDGTLEVFYLEERPPSDEGPFLHEERRLFVAVAERLGRLVERERIERALSASEERYRDLIESASDLIQSISPDGRYLYVNRAWREALGYSEGEVASLTMDDIIHPGDMDHCREVIDTVFAGERTAGVEARFICKDGREIRVEGNASCHVEAGEPVYTRGIFRDVTERKATEEVLRTANRELEAFAHTLSHDLRSPLATAFGYARLLENYRAQGLDEEGREWLSEISRSLSGMDVMITSLLEYARAGRPSGDIARVDPARVLDEILQGLKPTLVEKKVAVDGDLPAIRVDAVKLRQVLQNLVDNAIKYGAGVSAARIEIGAEREGEICTFHVRDNGAGIPPEELRSVFEPFVRLESGKTSSGLGIGLSTVKRAVEGWGGTVWAESTPGKGTTFFFTAPAA